MLRRVAPALRGELVHTRFDRVRRPQAGNEEVDADGDE